MEDRTDDPTPPQKHRQASIDYNSITDVHQRLLQACLRDDVEAARIAIAAGADVRMRVRGPMAPWRRSARARRCHEPLWQPGRIAPLLHMAVGQACPPLVELLLVHGADASGRCSDSGDTALHVVSRARLPLRTSVELIRLLCASGAHLDAVDSRGLTAAHAAAYIGNVPALSMLLASGASAVVQTAAPDRRADTLLHAAVRSNSGRCVAAVLDRCTPQLLAACNSGGHTPLQLAESRELVKQLLSAGARADEPVALSLLRNAPAALADVFNHYTTTNDQALDSSQLRVFLDYTPFSEDTRPLCSPETSLLRAIIDADQDQLLKIPLVETFLHIKWQQIRRFFYMNFVFHVLLVATVTSYCLIRLSDPRSVGADVTAGLTSVFTLILIIREAFQITYSWRLYIRSVENWLELFTIVMMMTVLAHHGRNVERTHHMMAWLLLTIWLEMTLMIGRSPSIGIYIYMFVRVAQRLIKFILVYSTLIVAFSLSFHILFRERQTSFKTIPLALIKTFIMMTGEYNYDDTFAASELVMFPGTAHLLMLAFVVFMSIITVNLLMGLTVNDIQGVFKTAGVHRLRTTVIQLLYTEKAIFSRLPLPLLTKPIQKRIRHRMTFISRLRTTTCRHVDESNFPSEKLSSDKKNEEALLHAPHGDAESNDSIKTANRRHCVALRPNERGAGQVYRIAKSGDLVPIRFHVESWMTRNVLRLLHRREDDDDRRQRQQSLQDEVQRVIRVETAQMDPFWEMVLDYDNKVPQKKTDNTAAQILNEPQDPNQHTQETTSGGTTRRRHRGSVYLHSDSEGREGAVDAPTASEITRKLDTVLTAVSELSLRMSRLERRNRQRDHSPLDTCFC